MDKVKLGKQKSELLSETLNYFINLYSNDPEVEGIYAICYMDEYRLNKRLTRIPAVELVLVSANTDDYDHKCPEVLTEGIKQKFGVQFNICQKNIKSYDLYRESNRIRARDLANGIILYDRNGKLNDLNDRIRQTLDIDPYSDLIKFEPPLQFVMKK